MQYENIDSAEMAELALSQAVDEHIEKSKEAIDRISVLEKQILTGTRKTSKFFGIISMRCGNYSRGTFRFRSRILSICGQFPVCEYLRR
jgi:hypothetical protein